MLLLTPSVVSPTSKIPASKDSETDVEEDGGHGPKVLYTVAAEDDEDEDDEADEEGKEDGADDGKKEGGKGHDGEEEEEEDVKDKDKDWASV